MRPASSSLYLPLQVNSAGRAVSESIRQQLAQVDRHSVSSILLNDTNTAINTTDRPTVGSLVQYATSPTVGTPSSLGVILDDQNKFLTSHAYKVMGSAGQIDMVPPSFITYHDRDLVGDVMDKTDVLFTLRTLQKLSMKLTDRIIDKNLPADVYIQLAHLDKQSSTTLDQVVHLLKDSTVDSYMTNKLGPSSLNLCIHSILTNDPVHFRYVRQLSSLGDDINSYGSPLNLRTSPYLINPITLSRQLLQIYNYPAADLRDHYPRQMTKYDSFVLQDNDPLYCGLIRFIKYAVEYPHAKLQQKLAQLQLPTDPTSLFKYLVTLGVYEDTSNPAICSEVYGQIPVSGMVASSLSQLKPYDKKSPPNTTRLDVPVVKPKENTTIFRIDDDLAFSCVKETLTKQRFHFFLDLPRFKLSSSMISHPINYTQIDDSMADQLPKHRPFKTRRKNDRVVFRLSFIFDYLSAESVTEPRVEIELDKWKASRPIPDLFLEKKRDRKTGVTMARSIALDKLDNLLSQWEQARVEQGLLTPPQSSDQTIAEKVRLMLDEYATLYCDRENVPVIHRLIDSQDVESSDRRKSTRFKIFKWYSNSYETFRGTASKDETSYISALRYLDKPKVCTEPGGPMKQLGLRPYASFMNWDFTESYVNNLQLFNHLTNNRLFDFNTLLPKILANGNAMLQMRDRLKRIQVINRLDRSSFTLLRCIIVDPPETAIIDGETIIRRAKAYCTDLDIIVEVETPTTKIMVGDRLICSEIVTANAITCEVCIK